jgi:hypothetical protein
VRLYGRIVEVNCVLPWFRKQLDSPFGFDSFFLLGSKHAGGAIALSSGAVDCGGDDADLLKVPRKFSIFSRKSETSPELFNFPRNRIDAKKEKCPKDK